MEILLTVASVLFLELILFPALFIILATKRFNLTDIIKIYILLYTFNHEDDK